MRRMLLTTGQEGLGLSPAEGGPLTGSPHTLRTNPRAPPPGLQSQGQPPSFTIPQGLAAFDEPVQDPEAPFTAKEGAVDTGLW